LLLTSIVAHEKIEILLLTSLDHEHVRSHIRNSASIVAHERNEILLLTSLGHEHAYSQI